jgi:hypothetical protein
VKVYHPDEESPLLAQAPITVAGTTCHKTCVQDVTLFHPPERTCILTWNIRTLMIKLPLDNTTISNDRRTLTAWCHYGTASGCWIYARVHTEQNLLVHTIQFLTPYFRDGYTDKATENNSCRSTDRATRYTLYKTKSARLL